MNNNEATPTTETGIDADAGHNQRAEYVLNLLGDSPASPDTEADQGDDNVEELQDEEQDVSEEYDEYDAEADQDDSEESDDEAEEESEEQPELYTVKVDGEEVEVTFDELLKGYSREADYSRKTQKLGDERRELESEREEIQKLKQNEEQVINHLMNLAYNLDPILSESQNTDWNKLAQEDPDEYTRKRAALEEKQRQVQQLQQYQKQMRDQQMQEMLQKESKALEKALPEWSNQETREYESKAIRKYLADTGFSNEEVDQLVDHRTLLVARDAMKYRELMNKQGTAKAKKTKPQAKSMRPGKASEPKSAQRAQSAKALAAAKKSGSTDDIVNAVLQNIGN